MSFLLFCYCLTSITSEFEYRHIKNSGIVWVVGTYSIQKTCRPLAQRVALGNSEIKAKPEETKLIHHVYKGRKQTSYTCLIINVQSTE